ncbi:SPFH domain / Band 7 family protein [Bremerella volcania]|uniref:SPFH domain / Band 7 family protein n=1 Tax=Bremerella volcania TaxID=2527984 RepID=A0A518C833_9BACT|nr:SPFH domain-containing protein [Bremerella volcania]QDU75362.1 SPFH domain / Band 7 family protein [Bremerella volcania]
MKRDFTWSELLCWRLIGLVCLVGFAVEVDLLIEHYLWPIAANELAVRQMESPAWSQALQTLTALHASLPMTLLSLVLMSAVVLIGPLLWARHEAPTPSQAAGRSRSSKRSLLALAGVFVLVATSTGCRPFDTPEFEEIDTSETGFLIPLEGATDKQVAFESESYLAERKVAAKRVQVPHRWVQTGRMYNMGQWMDTVRLIKVDRSPVTREWTADSSSGTKTANEAIWIESKDSVGFSVGFNCTAFIEEDDTARFLYMYRSRSLADMMDSEVRARIQSVAAETAAKYDLDELRSRKQEMVDDVRKDVIAFFKERGITVTTIGMFGGFTYQNPKIQEAIDETFVAQQKKVINMALFDAQQKENERIELEAEGQANMARTIAEGEADAIMKIAQATREAQSDPLFVQLKQFEVERDRIEKWNGEYPSYLLQMDSGSQSPSLMLQLPAQTASVLGPPSN